MNIKDSHIIRELYFQNKCHKYCRQNKLHIQLNNFRIICLPYYPICLQDKDLNMNFHLKNAVLNMLSKFCHHKQNIQQIYQNMQNKLISNSSYHNYEQDIHKQVQLYSESKYHNRLHQNKFYIYYHNHGKFQSKHFYIYYLDRLKHIKNHYKNIHFCINHMKTILLAYKTRKRVSTLSHAFIS